MVCESLDAGSRHVTILATPRTDRGIAFQRDLGGVAVAGSTTFDGIVYEVKASGADIWGTADAFRIVRESGRFARELTARVRSVSNTHAWAKAGVMFRQSPESAQSPHVMVVVTPGKGVAMQYRPQFNQQSVQVAVRAGAAPKWVRLTQLEGTFKGYASENGVTWQLIRTITVPWTGEPALAVTSHNNGALTDYCCPRERAAAAIPQPAVTRRGALGGPPPTERCPGIGLARYATINVSCSV